MVGSLWYTPIHRARWSCVALWCQPWGLYLIWGVFYSSWCVSCLLPSQYHHQSWLSPGWRPVAATWWPCPWLPWNAQHQCDQCRGGVDEVDHCGPRLTLWCWWLISLPQLGVGLLPAATASLSFWASCMNRWVACSVLDMSTSISKISSAFIDSRGIFSIDGLSWLFVSAVGLPSCATPRLAMVGHGDLRLLVLWPLFLGVTGVMAHPLFFFPLPVIVDIKLEKGRAQAVWLLSAETWMKLNWWE